jgi:hypothetical protein
VDLRVGAGVLEKRKGERQCVIDDLGEDVIGDDGEIEHEHVQSHAVFAEMCPQLVVACRDLAKTLDALAGGGIVDDRHGDDDR